MIIDYDFEGKRVTIVGGGHETARKIRLFTEAGARVRLVGPAFDRDALRVAKRLRVPVVRCPASQVPRRAFARTDVVAVVADDRRLGRTLRPVATRRRVLFYVTDDPEVSDWLQPAVRVAPPIAVAVSTNGGSPIVARTLADRLVAEVRESDRRAVALQAYARNLARERIPSPGTRRFVLNRIFRDPRVTSALERGDSRGAKREAQRLILDAAKRARIPSHP